MPIFAFRDEESMASQTIEDQRQHLDTSWVAHDSTTARFEAFRALSEEARGAWVAFSIAQTLEATLNAPDSIRVDGFHDHLGRLLGIDVATWWRPNAANFFNRVKKDIMLDALEKIGGPILRGRYKDATYDALRMVSPLLASRNGLSTEDDSLATVADKLAELVKTA